MPVSPEVEHAHFGGRPAGEGTEDRGAAAISSYHQATEPRLGPSADDNEDEEEEPQPHRSIAALGLLTKAEMAEHRANGHQPYRSWCSDCVEGFGR